MKNSLIIAILTLLAIPIIASDLISADDLRFLLDREQFHIIHKYEQEFLKMADSADIKDRRLLLEYAQRTDKMDMALDLHYRIARDYASLEDALQWLILQSIVPVDHELLQIQHRVLSHSFSSVADSLVFAHYSTGEGEDIMEMIKNLTEYNDVIEASAKGILDEISTQASSHEALELIETFYDTYPHSQWHQAAYYYQLYHLLRLLDYNAFHDAIDQNHQRSAAHAYISALYLISPTFRRDYEAGSKNQESLAKARQCLEYAASADEAMVLFDSYDSSLWKNRVKLLDGKARYYMVVADIAPHGFIGDEEDLLAVLPKPDKEQEQLIKDFASMSFDTNDQGEQAEYYFWQGRIKALFAKKSFQEEAIKDFGQCLILGAPRKRYDNDALGYVSKILTTLGHRQSPIEYFRKIFDYDGIIFEDTQSIPDKNYFRVALADYDNDGLVDILFDGKQIYRNLGDFNFSPHPDEQLSRSLISSGGIWADINKDGYLDFATISHAADGVGEALMKQNPDGSFVKVNAKAGDIDDEMPSEGMAFVDVDGSGYPSLYIANYESWQDRSGYPDRFWHNTEGSFRDRSQEMGFLLPVYADNPGLAGRGVAPADFDNDGQQEILVTNYRLNRNYLFKKADSLYVDLGALYSVAGTYKNGYYGHSIGADWGDIDNDGDLDLIITNLAHPRFIDISDTTQLLRNDGLTKRVIAADTLYYWAFTDITAQSGITYDELHAEPLFFDADNDGFLDLFISSVYENDRSYLYRNNGDGTFTDVTYLSGARVYNGWSCATADLDRDGLTDLVVGSGNGTKIFRNVTNTENRALYLKPIYNGDNIDLIPISNNMPEHPNSPAFGARVKLTITDRYQKSRTLIRELSSAKGSSTQNAPELHFGLGTDEIISYELWKYEP